MNQPDLSRYREDAKGNLIPLDNIKPIDLARDELVREIFAAVQPAARELAQAKRLTTCAPLWICPPKNTALNRASAAT